MLLPALSAEVLATRKGLAPRHPLAVGPAPPCRTQPPSELSAGEERMKEAACPLLLSGSMGPDVDAILRSNHKRIGSPAIPGP